MTYYLQAFTISVTTRQGDVRRRKVHVLCDGILVKNIYSRDLHTSGGLCSIETGTSPTDGLEYEMHFAHPNITGVCSRN